MKTAFCGILLAFAVIFLPANSLLAQGHKHDPGSVATTWDKPCPGYPTSHSDYQWCKPGCDGSHKGCAHQHVCTQSCFRAGCSHADKGVSICAQCGHQHYSPANLYAGNCAMLDALQATYCVSTHYLVSLRARNNNSYAFACSAPVYSCRVCAPSVEYRRVGTLESLQAEISGLHARCGSAR